MKKCPYCAEEIQDEAVFCKYCKRDLPTAQPAVNNAAVYSNASQAYQVAKPKSNKRLVILVIVLAVLILLIGTLIIVPTLIGYYSKEYTVIPAGTYYDDHHKSIYENPGSMLSYYSAVDPFEAAVNGQELVSVLLCMDGTGEFVHSIDHVVYEQGSIIIDNDKAICKYDSGKQVEWDSINTNDDRTEIDVKILVDQKLKNFHCYLSMASDPDGNIIEGYSYEAIHGSAY